MINYDAVYPAGHRLAGQPVLKMLSGTQIISSDLTAIITGSSANSGGSFALSAFPSNVNTYPRRQEPFREIGDPAMVVDVPANSPCSVSHGSDPNEANKNQSAFTQASALRDGQPCTPTTGRKATKAFYPDDPSNVYHSYLSDHVKFRVLHAGSKEHHIHHLHAHQWLYSSDNDKSSYLDSQAVGPGASFTTEIAKGGSGNLNQTVGDSIFHCHFYPHFAQGMWALWRVHDVLEKGTVLDAATGRPASGSRALPDGEIADGTPIPAVVPLPRKPVRRHLPRRRRAHRLDDTTVRGPSTRDGH